MTRLAVFERIVTRHQAEEVEGVLVDVMTACLLVQAYRAVDAEKRARLDAVPLGVLGTRLWRLAR